MNSHAFRPLILLATLHCTLASITVAAPHNPNTDWFQKAGYGVFVHYLEGLQNNPDQINSLGKRTSWDQCVTEFDVDRFASAMEAAGAGYVIFTMMQQRQYLISPNARFDQLTGYKPGDACSRRDLVLDLHRALSRKDIPLMLYWTGDGPSGDAQAGAGMGWDGQANATFVTNWASVVAEYGLRYKGKVVGWWTDGCYDWIGYNDDKLGVLARGLKAGNPKRIVCFNPGVFQKVKFYSVHDDFTAGEMNDFLDRPADRWIGGVQWHIASYLGGQSGGNGMAWAKAGTKYSKAELAKYIVDVNSAGGVVSVDMLLYRDGSVDRSQLEVMRTLRERMKSLKTAAAIPPGNLACNKPARLLSHDGTRELDVNGGDGGQHYASMGVDGDPNTTALAGGEWAWTYEVDLLRPRDLSKIVITFPANHYATAYQLSGSTDYQAWTRLAENNTSTGGTHTHSFEPAKAQYIRLTAITPNGPDQPGAQMTVSELEAYE